MMNRIGLLTCCTLASAMLVACGDDAPVPVDGMVIVIPEAGMEDAMPETGMPDGDTPTPDASGLACGDPQGLGSRCTEARGCQRGECLPEATGVIGMAPDEITNVPDGVESSFGYTVRPDGLCAHAYGPDACDENDPEAACGPCGNCDFIGRDTSGASYYQCNLKCEANVTDNDICRDGYSCGLTNGSCSSGCSADTECRIYREDTNGDGEIDDGPDRGGVDRLVYDRNSDGTCSGETFRCEHSGTASARAGDPCSVDSDCEANGRCLTEERYGWTNGYCVKFGCDVPGNECAGMSEGVVCQERGVGVALCLEGCEFGSGWTADDPATPDVDEADVDMDGSHFDDYAASNGGCDTGYSCVWNGTSGPGVPTSGACLPSTPSPVVEPNPGFDCSRALDDWREACMRADTPCRSDCMAGDAACLTACDTTLQGCLDEHPDSSSFCYSPLGLGFCSIAGDEGYCLIRDCGTSAVPEDMCGDSGLCLNLGSMTEPAPYCVQTCTAASDCNSPELGCVLVSTMGTDRICWPACQTSADCQTGYTCDVAVGSTFGDCVPM